MSQATPTHMPEPWAIQNGVIRGADESPFYLRMQENTKRVLECVNAMQGIESPMLYTQERQVRPVAVDNPITVFGDSLPELEAKMTEQIAKRSQDAFRYHQLKEVIDHMLAKLDEGTAITLTKDSILTIAFREAIK